MRRFVSVVLIIACLGLNSCKPKEKDKESKVNDTINPAFYSEHTLEHWCEEQDWLEYDDVDWLELYDLADENKDTNTGYMTDEAFEEWADETVSDRMIYSFSRPGDGSWLYCIIQDVDALHHHMGDRFKRKIETKPQGLFVGITIKENYKLSDEYDSMEDYLKTIHVLNDWPELNSHEVFETSSGIYIVYGEYSLFLPSDDSGEYVQCMYVVEMWYFDSEAETMVKIEYNLPIEDNDEEIQELRDLGIPVFTDFIDQD